MHAYLLIGKDESSLDNEAQRLAQKLGTSLMEFPLSKIEDMRELTRIMSLSLSAPTAIYIKGIDATTLEAQNAFLKLLEEPQENLNFILSAGSSSNLLPTISSRCQIVRLKNIKREVSQESEDFSKMSVEEKLIFVESIHKRDRALKFMEDIIENWHQRLLKGENSAPHYAHNLKRALYAHTCLKANGNILLQLTNFVISLE